MGFYKLHANSFDNAEENKLEYTTIHSAYVEVIEAYLDKFLQDKFTDD